MNRRTVGDNPAVDWSTGKDPAALFRLVRLRASDRQLRLFAAGCCRLVWDMLPRDECRQAILLAESYADNRLSGAELDVARRELFRAIADEHGHRARLAQAAGHLLRVRSRSVVMEVLRLARTGWGQHHLRARQCDLLRDIFQDPGQRACRFPGVSGAVRELALAIDAGRDFTCLPELADALEASAGAPPELLAHLRGPGPHTKGCWAVDVVMGLH